MSGALEVLSGWSAGSLVSLNSSPLWVPGSYDNGDRVLRFSVAASGIWRFEERNEPEASTTRSTSV